METELFTLQNVLTGFLGLIAAVLLSSLVPRWLLRLRYRNLPPGPFCWPVLGYVPFFDQYKGYLSLKKCAQKYGGVFSMYMGSSYVVCIHNWEALKDSYNREEFLGKLDGQFSISPDRRQRSIGDLEGPPWKEQKKFFLNSLRILAMRSQDFGSITMSQISDVISNLKRKQGRDVNVSKEVELALNNVTYQLLFGKIYDHGHPMIKLLGDYDDAMLKFLGLSLLGSLFPWAGRIVRYLPVYKSCAKVLEKMDDIIKQEINEHRQTLNENEPRDFVDLFLTQMQKPGLEKDYNIHTLLGNLKIQLLGASETTRNSMVWFVLLMAKHQDMQQEIQRQIDAVLGREREPLSSDKPQLPLLEAAVLESQRFRNLGHITPPRSTTRDTTLCGYDIPKGTTVLYGMTSHLRNPELWKNPDQFHPSHFLSEDKTRVHVPDFFIPFSYGKRNCPGERLAQSTLFLFAASLLQRFTILPPDGGVNLDIKVVLNNGQAHPYARFQLRD